METEIPAILRAREAVEPERFTFHSSRMRMKKVTKEELAAMDADSDRCAAELADARVDVLGYACLVAIMSMGKGYHCQSQQRLQEVTAREGAPAPVVTSAGALVDGLQDAEGEEDRDGRALREVAVHDGGRVHRARRHRGRRSRSRSRFPTTSRSAAAIRWRSSTSTSELKLDGVDALVLSSCVQMPSLAAIPIVEQECGLPVVSASVCTTYQMLQKLGLKTVAPDAGALLSGRY